MKNAKTGYSINTFKLLGKSGYAKYIKKEFYEQISFDDILNNRRKLYYISFKNNPCKQ